MSLLSPERKSAAPTSENGFSSGTSVASPILAGLLEFDEERRLLRERDLGVYVSPTRETVTEYLTRWLRDYVKANLSRNTYEGYSRCIKRYVEPHIGDLVLSKVRPQHVKAMYTALREQPARGGGKLSGHTRK
jgi:hypothetical protein